MSINSRLKIMSLISALSCWGGTLNSVCAMDVLSRKSSTTSDALYWEQKINTIYGTNHKNVECGPCSLKNGIGEFQVLGCRINGNGWQDRIEKTRYFYLPDGSITDAGGNPLCFKFHEGPIKERWYIEPYILNANEEQRWLRLKVGEVNKAEERNYKIRIKVMDANNWEWNGSRLKTEIQELFKDMTSRGMTYSQFFSVYCSENLPVVKSPWVQWEKDEMLRDSYVDNQGYLRHRDYKNAYLTYSSTLEKFCVSCDPRDKLHVEPTTVELYGLRRN